jgi:hypothetical protein
MVQPLLELRPTAKAAVLDVDRAIGVGQRRQEDAKRDDPGHYNHAALPEVPTGVTGELHAPAPDALQRPLVAGPEQEAQREEQKAQRVAVLVAGEVEDVGGEGCGAGHQAEQRLPPAQHTPAQPTTNHPEQAAEEIEEEARVAARVAVHHPVGPGPDQAQGIGRIVGMRGMEDGIGGQVARHGGGGQPQPQRQHRGHPPGQGEDAHEHGRDEGEVGQHLGVRHPSGGDRRVGDADDQKEQENTGDKGARGHPAPQRGGPGARPVGQHLVSSSGG